MQVFIYEHFWFKGYHDQPLRTWSLHNFTYSRVYHHSPWTLNVIKLKLACMEGLYIGFLSRKKNKKKRSILACIIVKCFKCTQTAEKISAVCVHLKHFTMIHATILGFFFGFLQNRKPIYRLSIRASLSFVTFRVQGLWWWTLEHVKLCKLHVLKGWSW